MSEGTRSTDLPFYGSNPVCYNIAISMSSLLVLPANPVRRGLIFHNPNASLTIAVCPTTNNLGQPVTAVINGAGTFTLVSLGTLRFDPGTRPVGAWNAVCSGTGALTILEML
jgi:hypothetical protein